VPTCGRGRLDDPGWNGEEARSRSTNLPRQHSDCHLPAAGVDLQVADSIVVEGSDDVLIGLQE
jgi:hypothetical protein